MIVEWANEQTTFCFAAESRMSERVILDMTSLFSAISNITLANCQLMNRRGLVNLGFCILSLKVETETTFF